MCKNMVTAEYILKYEKEERRQADEYNREKMAIFSKRRGVATLVTVILIVVVIVNGQIEYLLTECVKEHKKSGRYVPKFKENDENESPEG